MLRRVSLSLGMIGSLVVDIWTLLCSVKKAIVAWPTSNSVAMRPKLALKILSFVLDLRANLNLAEFRNGCHLDAFVKSRFTDGPLGVITCTMFLHGMTVLY